METRVLRPGGPDSPEIALAADLLREGGLVALPTETVYGLGANGLDSGAVARIYAAKGRPATKPVSLLVAGLAEAADVVSDIPEAARKLARAFWPGPLTIILPRSDRVPDVVTAGGDTVGLRCPDHPVTLAVLRLFALPVAAPSANPSGGPSPRSAGEALRALDGKIHAVVDGGPCAMGVESTILDLTATPPKILRRGGLEPEAIAACIGEVEV